MRIEGVGKGEGQGMILLDYNGGSHDAYGSPLLYILYETSSVEVDNLQSLPIKMITH